MLYPLEESYLPKEVLRVWQRSPIFFVNTHNTLKHRLNNLIKFLKNEVESEERISLTVKGLGYV